MSPLPPGFSPPAVDPSLVPPAPIGAPPQVLPTPQVAPLIPAPAGPAMAPPAGPPALHGYNPVNIVSAPPEVATPENIVYAPETLQSVTDIELPDVNSLQMRDFSKFESKLEVRNPDPQLEYRWVNSDTQRQAQLHAEGYRPVRSRERARSEVHGAETPELFAGTDSSGAVRRAILMARPKVLRQRRNAAYRELVRKNQAALDPKQYSGNNGTTDNASYTGALQMGGSINP